jgi:hypothetical protein
MCTAFLSPVPESKIGKLERIKVLLMAKSWADCFHPVVEDSSNGDLISMFSALVCEIPTVIAQWKL